MRAFEKYRHQSPEFWALVKFVSQELGYTDRKTKSIRTFSETEITKLLDDKGFLFRYEDVQDVVDYSQKRAHILNTFARSNLMNALDAQALYSELSFVAQSQNYVCAIPMNKQKGDMRQVAFLTASINILAEKTLREAGLFHGQKCFNDDPRSLLYAVDRKGYLTGASSRRMDGAYPDVTNPKIVWEIKEYYYTTSFGSRVADGIYETRLDGHELKDISNRTLSPIMHVMFVDGYRTWWEDGKSYLCRLIDILNEGLVDEVIVGREVLTRWPEVLRSVL